MDAVSVSILLEGLHPSLSGFVRSALRQQKPMFSNVIQEAELIHRSVMASNAPVQTQSSRFGPSVLSRGLPETLRPYRGDRAIPVMTADIDLWSSNSNYGDPFDGYMVPPKPPQQSAVHEPGVPEAPADALEEILLATLSRTQQLRYCYTCWRAGHYSVDCPLIPKGEREAIAKRRSEVMRTRSSQFLPRNGVTTQSPDNRDEILSSNLIASFHDQSKPILVPENSHLLEDPIQLRESC
jgi:hypothetical protein